VQKSNSFKSQKPVIAIDGTAGSGKGTLAKKLANLIKFDHLDTGLLYRICALEMLERKVNLKNVDIASWLGKDKDLSILRSEKVSKETSKISKDPKVRKFLLKFQRDFGDYPPNGFGSVVDGRDIWSIVFPNAEVKFYIDASPMIRAKRRLKELSLKSSDYSKILKNIIERDNQDKSRKNSPLLKTKTAFLIDSSNLDIEEVLEYTINILKKNTEFIK
jgi:cytidylate kinase